ncbi:hypothetical protein EHM76_02755 [bacterium]|nr:MAG: hypothetical protein EHM76_02755 [bacterium]
MISVGTRYFHRFGIDDNFVEAMMTDESLVTYISCGYDGTVFLRGCGIMPWQGIRHKESWGQQLPRWARKIVGDRNVFGRWAGRWFRKLRNKRIL